MAKALDIFDMFLGMGSLRILPLNIVTVVFDELGLTDNKNPFGLISFLHPFLDLLSAGKSVKINKKNRRTNIDIFRKKRSIEDPKVDPELIHGGERAFLYQVKKKNIFFSSS